MLRESKIVKAIKMAGDFLIIFDSYFRDPVWVTKNLWLSKEKIRKNKWYLVENNFLDDQLNVQKNKFNIYKLCKKWDENWRIVFFDIPEKRRRVRDKVRRLLKDLGLKGVQRSVWVTPLAIDNRIRQLKNKIDDYQNLYIFKGKIPLQESLQLVDSLWDYQNWQMEARKLINNNKSIKRKEFNKKFWDLVFTHPKLPLTLLPDNWPLGKLVKVFVKKASSDRLRS